MILIEFDSFGSGPFRAHGALDFGCGLTDSGLRALPFGAWAEESLGIGMLMIL